MAELRAVSRVQDRTKTSSPDEHSVDRPDREVDPHLHSVPEPQVSATSTTNIIKTNSTRPTHTRGVQEDIEEVNLDALPSRQRQRTNPSHTRPAQPRRARGKFKSEHDLARDALVDDILKESVISLYDTSSTAAGGNHLGGKRNVPGGDDGDRVIDNDAAVAEAFRAEFMAEMEERNLRRRPPGGQSSTAGGGASSAANSNAAGNPSGPKLGGSRSMREKMRAAMQNQGAGQAQGGSSQMKIHAQSQSRK